MTGSRTSAAPRLLLLLLPLCAPQTAGEWREHRLLAGDRSTGDLFGGAVALDGGVAIVGAWWDDVAGADSGSAYAFERQADGTWQQTYKFQPADAVAANYFGQAVALSGATAIIGAYGEDAHGSDNPDGRTCGAAYAFERQADRSWRRTFKFMAADATAGDRFGYSLAVDGDTALISAYTRDGPGDSEDARSDFGAVYAFQRQSGGQWTQTDLLVADDGERVDEFGKSVDLDGNTAIIGKCMLFE